MIKRTIKLICLWVFGTLTTLFLFALGIYLLIYILTDKDFQDPVKNAVEQYITSSSVIKNDIGAIKTIEHDYNGKSTEHAWMDYSAELFVRVTGTKGVGTLELRIAGNNHKEISSKEGDWTYLGKRTPLDFYGDLHTSRVKLDRWQITEEKFNRAVTTGKCENIFSIIRENEIAVKEGRDYRLSGPTVTLAKGRCYHQQNLLEKAAREYARYAFLKKPHPFREKLADLPDVAEAKTYINLSLKIGTDPLRQKRRRQRLTIIEIQESLTKDPCNKKLRQSLRDALEITKVFYRTIPNCPTTERHEK